MADWTDKKIARLGYLTGQGRTSREIARDLGGLTGDQVRSKRRTLGIQVSAAEQSTPSVPVRLTAAERKRLETLAEAIDVSSEEYLRRIAVCAIDDDLYVAVTDGRFD